MSGIYIPMEMPKSCDICDFVVEIDEGPLGSHNYCGFPGNGIYVDDCVAARHKSCPLIPVPDHGRLIDGDKVFKRLQKQAMSVWGDGNPRYQIILEVMDAIRFAPTIIPAEGS